MELYKKAYEQYIGKCEKFGIHPIDMIKFIQHVTQEQVELMLSNYTN